MDTIEKASDYAHEAADKIADAATQAAETLSQKGGQLLNAEQKMMKNCRNYVRDKPLTLLAVTLTAGFVLGRLCRDR